ncbi:MAG: hypothetical protein IPK70_15225 [Flavobacteriales bacterium]|nr:hypothetical protein [Flavobacteriales bacterium]
MSVLIERILEHLHRIANDPGATQQRVLVGDPLDTWPDSLSWVPGDVQELYQRCNGLYAYVDNTRTGRLHVIAFDRMGSPDAWVTMQHGWRSWGHVPADAVRAGAPPEGFAPDDRFERGIYYWNALDGDPRFRDGAELLIFCGASGSAQLVLEHVPGQGCRYLLQDAQHYLTPTRAQGLTAILERGLELEFQDGWLGKV